MAEIFLNCMKTLNPQTQKKNQQILSTRNVKIFFKVYQSTS